MIKLNDIEKIVQNKKPNEAVVNKKNIKDCTICKHDGYCKRTEEICSRVYTKKEITNNKGDCSNCNNNDRWFDPYTGGHNHCTLDLRTNIHADYSNCKSFASETIWHKLLHLGC